MTTLFDNYVKVKAELVQYLTSVNENINWNDFLDKYGTLPDHKVLKRIRSLVWIDKSIDYDPQNYTTAKYFAYYTSLLMKFMPILSPQRPIHIIPPLPDTLLSEFQYDIDAKFSVLQRILKLMNIAYKVIDMTKIPKDIEILLPLGSICYADIAEKFAEFTGIVIPDGYDNICVTKNDEILNNFILNIKALMMSPEDVSAIYKPSYNMFYVKRA